MNWLSKDRVITNPELFAVSLEPDMAIMCFEPKFYSIILEFMSLNHAVAAPAIAGGLKGRVSGDLVVYLCYFGAPAAGLHLDSLIALGVKKVMVLGEAGSISPNLRIGDIYLPLWGIREEGTSYHYLSPDVVCEPSSELLGQIRIYLDQENPLEGGVWTTDAGLRETEDKIREYSRRGAYAVEMECTALMSIAMYRKIDLACLLVITDELFTGEWIRGFNQLEVTTSKKRIVEAIKKLMHQ
jgi:uridine phosphorylase